MSEIDERRFCLKSMQTGIAHVFCAMEESNRDAPGPRSIQGHDIYICEREASKKVLAEWQLCLRCCLLGPLDCDGVLPNMGITLVHAEMRCEGTHA